MVENDYVVFFVARFRIHARLFYSAVYLGLADLFAVSYVARAFARNRNALKRLEQVERNPFLRLGISIDGNWATAFGFLVPWSLMPWFICFVRSNLTRRVLLSIRRNCCVIYRLAVSLFN